MKMGSVIVENGKKMLTMTEYIKRTDAVKIAEKYGLANGSALGRHTGLADCIARDISELPAADVAEVVHGRWIGAPLCGNDNCKCSECGSWHNIHANLRGKIKQKYCPNCGAKMDGGGGNSDMA